MEAFVDRIIETDRKAREMIESAQQQKAVMQKQAVVDAHAALEDRAAQDQTQMQLQDEAMRAREVTAMELADSDYIREKHKLDAAFVAGIDGWLEEITSACISV